MSDFLDLLKRLWGADEDASKAPDVPPDGASSTCPNQDQTQPYIVDVKVCTRLNDVPIKGLPVTLDDSSMGNTDQDGKVPESSPRTKTSFTVKVVWENRDGQLRREEAAIKVTGISVPGGSFSAQQVNFIDKIRDVAGTLDDRSFTDSYTPTTDEVLYETRGSDHIFHVVVHMATFSLQVPYYNQRAQSERIETSNSYDPEGASHELKPFFGDYLCFPSSMTMLLRYWGLTDIARNQVMQDGYEVWGKNGFKDRTDKDPDTIESDSEPQVPDLGTLWLDTKSPADPVHGFPLKRYEYVTTWAPVTDDPAPEPDSTDKNPPKNPEEGEIWLDISKNPPILKRCEKNPEWQVFKELNWRPKAREKNAAGSWDYTAIWEYFWIECEVAKQRKPAGTQCREWVKSVQLQNLPAQCSLQGGQGTYASDIAQRLGQGLPLVVSTTATAGHIMIIRGAVVDNTMSIVKLIVNDPYGTLESPKSLYHDLKIQDQVGKDAHNDSNDVEQVQAALNAIGYFDADIDGQCSGAGDDPLVQAIKKFQKHELHRKAPDGQIDKGGVTETTLRKLAMKRSTNYRIKGERNDPTREGDAGKRGQHQYYDDSTHGNSGAIKIKAKDRGCVMLEKNPPFTKSELTDRLTPHA